jgi:hypothetical protein
MSNTSFDVVVVGGGTSGSMAALAAARAGARTCLVEGAGYVGGTCLALANALPFHNNRGEPVVAGYPQEFVDRMIASGGAMEGGHLPNPSGIGGSFTPLDPEVMKFVLLSMLDEAGVALWLHTMLIEALTAERKVVGVRVSNKSGLHTLRAPVFIDATGDADLASAAGAAYSQDTPQEALSATFLFRVGGVDTDRFMDHIRANPRKMVLVADPYQRAVRGLGPENVMGPHVRSIFDAPYIYLTNLVQDFIPRPDWSDWDITAVEKEAWGRLRPFASRFSIMPLPFRKDVVTINATNIAFDATNAKQRSHAEIEGQRQARLAMALMRRYIPGFAEAKVHSTLPSVSVRASRRIIGEYELTREDVENERRFPDAIARGSYPMSVQSRERPNLREHLFVRNGGDYDIPYRCFVPSEIDGLLIAGRCLSASREASGSARMGAQCMAYGQGVGTAAAIAVKRGIAPRNVGGEELRTALKQANAVV